MAGIVIISHHIVLNEFMVQLHRKQGMVATQHRNFHEIVQRGVCLSMASVWSCAWDWYAPRKIVSICLGMRSGR